MSLKGLDFKFWPLVRHPGRWWVFEKVGSCRRSLYSKDAPRKDDGALVHLLPLFLHHILPTIVILCSHQSKSVGPEIMAPGTKKPFLFVA